MNIPFVLDKWQKEILKATGNICVNSGRQVGKSQIIAIKVAEYMRNNPNSRIMVISVTEDQAEMMLQKIVLYLYDNCKKDIAKGKNKPTKHLLRLTNGSYVKCKAVGQYGLGVLGHTLDILVPDEAAYMPEAIWTSVSPMMLTTGGNIWMLSTPNNKEGYFYKAYTESEMGFKTFHVNSEQVAEARPEPQKTIMKKYLQGEKARMSELQYAQQYLAQFLEELRQLFPDNLIKSTQSLQREQSLHPLPLPPGEYYLGVDVARMGKDDTTFEILEKKEGKLYQRENIIKKKLLTTQTTQKIIELNKRYNFKRIYIDDGGLGVAVFDQLLIEESTKRKTTGINNASRPLDIDKKRSKKILKEDLYLNLLRLMERKEIFLLDDPEIFTSLKSLVVESNKTKTGIRIHGRYTHIAEGLIRAAWCIKDKRLNIWIC